jgi:hypothetical protein
VAAQADRINYDTVHLDRKMPAVRASGPIVLDGVLDEGSWQDAPVADGFLQAEPREGQAASEATEVRVLYDDTNLYIGVAAHDREPGRIITSDLKKDYNAGESDGFGVVLDTFNDRRNGYLFYINAMGAKWDAQMVGDGREINANWDGVWNVGARIAEDGWYAEIAIPLRTFKFGSESPQTWGINFMRRIRRRNEDAFWSPLPRIYRLQRVSLAGTLEGLQGLHPGANLKVKPYALASGGWTAGSKAAGDRAFGVDAKYGVTTGLTWDFTVNTDFSQVEADEQQVNLSRFSLFFPEKRDFFLENSGVFQFGPGNDRMTGARQNSVASDVVLFFSRRVGLNAAGDAIPLGGGTRLTGRAGRYSIGALAIHENELGKTPPVNFTTFRVRRDILRNSDVGVIFMNKDEEGPRFNRTVGADMNLRFFRNFNINSFVAKTFSPTSVVKGSGGDVSARAGFAYSDSFWDVRGFLLTIGERFNDEMGYVPRVGVNRGEAMFGVHQRFKSAERWLREIYPHYQIQNVTRTTGGLDSRYPDYHVQVRFQNGSMIEPGINGNTENLIAPFTVNSKRNIKILPGRYDFNEYFVFGSTNGSARFAANWRLSAGDFYTGQKNSYQIGLTTKVNENMNFSATLSRNEISLPAGGFTTNLVTAKLNYNFSTKMFVNALVQYNTDAQQWSSNIRFNIIHHPLSDFFIVYNERHDTLTNEMQNRALIAKLTYMLAF